MTVQLVFCFAIAASFNSPLIDGGLQLLNPMRRIASGQIEGIDFQFFHGPGMPFLHYPIFALFGKTMFGSEFARYFVSLVAFCLVNLAVGKAITKTWRHSALFLVAGLLFWEITSFAPRYIPLNSLISLRSTVPFLVFAFLAGGISPKKRMLLIPCLLAIAVWLSTEQGISIIAGYLVAGIVFAITEENSRAKLALQCLLEVTVAIAIFLGLLVAGSGIHGAAEILRFSLFTIPAEQFWYFGSPPNITIANWFDLVRAPRIVMMAPLLMAGIVAIVFARFRKMAVTVPAYRMHAVLVLLTYGLFNFAVFLGYISSGHVAITGFVLFVATSTLLWHYQERVQVLIASAKHQKTMRFAVALVLVMAVSKCLLTTISLAHFSLTAYLRNPTIRFDEPLDEQNQTYLKSAIAVIDSRYPNIKQGNIWSTYAGLVEAHYSVTHPASDYIIHALGPNLRSAYVDTFRSTRPRIVQTVNPQYTYYEEWIQNSSWDFYAELLAHYQVIGITKPFLIWERQEAGGHASDWQKANIVDDKTTLSLPSNAAEQDNLVEVKIKYKTDNPLARLPVIGKTPRFLVYPENSSQKLAVSLSPNETERTFPLRQLGGRQIALHWRTRALYPGPSLKVEEVSYRIWTIQKSTLEALTAKFE